MIVQFMTNPGSASFIATGKLSLRERLYRAGSTLLYRLCHALKNLPPIVTGLLPEQTHRGVPGAILAVEKPSPIWHLFQENEDWPAKRSRKMRDGGIACDNQIQILHDRRGIDESIWPSIEIVA
jgi:hypothetical protein